jgi:hypothetical protein
MAHYGQDAIKCIPYCELFLTQNCYYNKTRKPQLMELITQYFINVNNCVHAYEYKLT